MHDMYREFILDHYKNPRFHGVLDNADITYEDDNPLCGDVIRVDLRVNGDKRVVDAAFSGQGCAISQASASMLRFREKPWMKSRSTRVLTSSKCWESS